MARRFAALLFAVVVIAGALAIRNGTGHHERTLSETSRVDPYALFRSEPVSVLCAEELTAVCTRLEDMVHSTKVESAWATVERLARGGALGADAWLTFRPFDEMAVPQPPAESVLGAATPLGSSPIVIAGARNDITAVSAACPDARVRLSCAAAAPAAQLMLRDPATSALGALALTVPADELGLPPPGRESDGRVEAALATVLSRGRRTPVPYEDVSRLKQGAVALGLEADVVHSLDGLSYEERTAYAGAIVLYPLEARAAEAVLVSARSFRRAADMASLFATSNLRSTLEGLGYEVPGHALFLYPKGVFPGRPTIRTDLPPPAPARLRQLQALRPDPAAKPGGP